MPAQRLTATRIERLKPREKRYLVADREAPGLYIRVSPSGAKTFTIVGRDPAGKQIWREVDGTFVGDQLDEVRLKARDGIKRLKAGLDPFPPPPPKADSFGSVVTSYLDLHVAGNGRDGAPLRSKTEIERCLNKYVLPEWRDREFEEIKRSDVTKLLDSIVKNHGARQADYVLAIVRAIMNWQTARLDEYVSPVVRGMGRTKPAERKRKRILNDDEIRAIWPHLTDTFGALVKLLLLTDQRREKVASIRWDDLSDTGIWSIPTEEREKGNAEILALPTMAVDIVRAQPRVAGNDYVFAGRGSGFFNGYSKGKARLDERALDAQRRPLPNWTLHDLRRTSKSLMSRAGVRPDISERVMGHVISGVEGIYDRYQYFEEKKDALARLAALVQRILDPIDDNVVSFAGTR